MTALAAASSPDAWAQPGTLGFLVVFGMGVILFFVFRSMTRHLRKVRDAARAEEEAATRNAGPARDDHADTVTMADGTVTSAPPRRARPRPGGSHPTAR